MVYENLKTKIYFFLMRASKLQTAKCWMPKYEGENIVMDIVSTLQLINCVQLTSYTFMHCNQEDYGHLLYFLL